MFLPQASLQIAVDGHAQLQHQQHELAASSSRAVGDQLTIPDVSVMNTEGETQVSEDGNKLMKFEISSFIKDS